MTLASFTPHLAFGLDAMWVSVTVLAVIYAFIIAGRANRAVVALIGAAIVIIFGALDQAEAVKGIDWDTIGLLTGMMIGRDFPPLRPVPVSRHLVGAAREGEPRRHPAHAADHDRGPVSAPQQRQHRSSGRAGDARHRRGAQP
jgi:hypothetical protein